MDLFNIYQVCLKWALWAGQVGIHRPSGWGQSRMRMPARSAKRLALPLELTGCAAAIKLFIDLGQDADEAMETLKGVGLDLAAGLVGSPGYGIAVLRHHSPLRLPPRAA